RVARAGGRIVDARFLDRLLRGRVWIALLAIGLMGIVFIQVSMLRLNAGISNAITSAETLSHQNASLRADISKLDSGGRLADSAAALGMVQPAAGSVNYLDARKGDPRAAAQAMRPPRKDATGAGAGTSTGAGTATGTGTSTGAAATQSQATTATQAPTATAQPQAQAQAATAPPAATTATTQPQAAPTQTQAAPTQTAPTQTQAAPTQTQAAPTQTQTAPTQTQPSVTAAGGTGVTGQGGQ